MNSSGKFPTLMRLSRVLFSWKTLRRVTLAVAVLGTLIALFYATENWRGKRAWRRCERELESKGEVLTLAGVVPPRIPDDQNFAMTPLLAPLLDYAPWNPKTSEPMHWRDSNALA